MADIKQIKVGDTAYNIEPYTNYLPLAGGRMSGDIKMTENSTSIIFRSASADWYSGIYANSSGDEVLGIVVSNPRTHIMLGNADVSERPEAASLTPAIDIKNGKVGINKRLGTDSSADAGSYELDVNGTISANSVVLSTSGSLTTNKILHDGQEDELEIGDPKNSAFVTFVEDIHGPASEENWKITTDGEAFFHSGITTNGQLTANVGMFDRIELTEDSEYPGLTQWAYNSGEGESCYNFIGFTPSENNNPAILSNSGYISLYDGGPDGNDGAVSIEDSPSCNISMRDWYTACQQSWNKTETTNQINTKLFLVGATAQTGGQTTKSNRNVYIGTDNNLYSNGKKTAVEELTMPVTKRFLREHKSEHRDPLVDSNCKHFSLIDLYVKDDSGELQDLSFVLTIFGTINIVWGYSDESIENTGGYPGGSSTTRCRNGIRLVGYVNHLTKTFTGSLMEKPYSSNREKTLRTFVNEPITNFSASIEHCTIDGGMIWWSLDSASTDIKAL